MFGVLYQGMLFILICNILLVLKWSLKLISDKIKDVPSRLP